MDREVSQEEEVGVVGEGEGEEEAAKEEAKEEGNKIEEGENEDEEWKLDTQESKEEEEEMTIFKPKMKEFPKTATVVGLRIRAEPSFMVSHTHKARNDRYSVRVISITPCVSLSRLMP